MDAKPRLLDLFCGAGGAAMGYFRAGFDVTGVDIKPQLRYPFPFIQGDALEYVAAHGREYDVIHASPPCQGYSIMRNLPWLRGKEYPLLIAATRELLIETGRPWAIENVMGAKLPAGWLCGQMFHAPFFRHRSFEAGRWMWLQPPHPRHQGTVRNGRMLGSRARDVVAVPRKRLDNCTRGKEVSMRVALGHGAGAALAKTALGVEWMNRDEAAQAIPPAYTEFIGRQLMTGLGR